MYIFLILLLLLFLLIYKVSFIFYFIFKARNTDKAYVSVSLPFYVTYIFAAAPTGWTSVEHRTEIEFSFFYDAFLWKSASHKDDSLKASLSIFHIGTDSSGHLFFEFKTVAKFYGKN